MTGTHPGACQRAMTPFGPTPYLYGRSRWCAIYRIGNLGALDQVHRLPAAPFSFQAASSVNESGTESSPARPRSLKGRISSCSAGRREGGFPDFIIVKRWALLGAYLLGVIANQRFHDHISAGPSAITRCLCRFGAAGWSAPASPVIDRGTTFISKFTSHYLIKPGGRQSFLATRRSSWTARSAPSIEMVVQARRIFTRRLLVHPNAELWAQWQ